MSPQARTEGRKDPVVLQWDPWEGHLQVTDNIIVVVNLVVVIVFMVVVVDVVVGRALASKHHLHRHHHCTMQQGLTFEEKKLSRNVQL